MQINREEVYTIQLCEHMISHLRTIVHNFLYIQTNISSDSEREELKEVIEFARSFLSSTTSAVLNSAASSDDLDSDSVLSLESHDIIAFFRGCYRAEAGRSADDFFTFYKGVIAAAYELGFGSDQLNDFYEARQEFFNECFSDDEKTCLS